MEPPLHNSCLAGRFFTTEPPGRPQSRFVYHLINQSIARRDKKAFLSDQCKEIEENNRMGKTRDLFKKIRDTKGTLEIPREHFMQRWAG